MLSGSTAVPPAGDYLTLGQATKFTPARISANAIWRWCRIGIKSRSGNRVTLQHIRCGGRVFTTQAWLTAFFEAVAQADVEYFRRPVSSKPTTNTRTPQQRQKAIDKAKAELNAAGYV